MRQSIRPRPRTVHVRIRLGLDHIHILFTRCRTRREHPIAIRSRTPHLTSSHSSSSLFSSQSSPFPPCSLGLNTLLSCPCQLPTALTDSKQPPIFRNACSEFATSQAVNECCPEDGDNIVGSVLNSAGPRIYTTVHTPSARNFRSPLGLFLFTILSANFARGRNLMQSWQVYKSFRSAKEVVSASISCEWVGDGILSRKCWHERWSQMRLKASRLLAIMRSISFGKLNIVALCDILALFIVFSRWGVPRKPQILVGLGYLK